MTATGSARHHPRRPPSTAGRKGESRIGWRADENGAFLGKIESGRERVDDIRHLALVLCRHKAGENLLEAEPGRHQAERDEESGAGQKTKSQRTGHAWFCPRV